MYIYAVFTLIYHKFKPNVSTVNIPYMEHLGVHIHLNIYNRSFFLVFLLPIYQQVADFKLRGLISSPRILLSTANALRESNAKAQKPMPWMTARAHIKSDPFCLMIEPVRGLLGCPVGNLGSMVIGSMGYDL